MGRLRTQGHRVSGCRLHKVTATIATFLLLVCVCAIKMLAAVWHPIVNWLTGKTDADQSLASHGKDNQVSDVVREYVDLYDEKNPDAVKMRKSQYAKMVNHYCKIILCYVI